jgi:hypothetical protein
MKLLKREEVGEILHKIYGSEPDFRLESGWDGGYHFFSGNNYNNYYGGTAYAPQSKNIEDVTCTAN